MTQYEVYYKRLDPETKNEIGAMEAATFLKKSGLPDGKCLLSHMKHASFSDLGPLGS
jgi:hypothetical protein